MPTKILLPVDVGRADDWKAAIDTATDMARRYSAELHVIWVVPSVERNLKVMPEDHEPELDKFIASRFPKELGVKGQLRATLGSPHREIRAAADEIGVDLIIMGSHNPRFTDAVMGSNASQVTLHANCSVYVVR